MSTRLLIGSVCVVTFACGCRTAEDAEPDGSGETRIARADPVAQRSGAAAERSAVGAESEAWGLETSREVGGRNSGRGRDGGPVEDRESLDRGWPDQPRATPRARLPNDELAISLEILNLPDGVYEIDRSTPEMRRLWQTQKDLDAFLERINAREAWFQVIRVGPWRIRVVRDTFYDPYRRDSGWIDIDELDGQR